MQLLVVIISYDYVQLLVVIISCDYVTICQDQVYADSAGNVFNQKEDIFFLQK